MAGDSDQVSKNLRNKAAYITRNLFLKQSSRSDYCGLYSTGMLLSQLGVSITRDSVFRLFEIQRGNRNYEGTSDEQIGSVIARVMNVHRWRWQYFDSFVFPRVSQSIIRHLRRNHCPTLISFGALHKNAVWRCKHIAMVVDASDKVIELIDPLGSVPQGNYTANVWLLRGESPRHVTVIGNSYTVRPRSEVGILHWFTRAGA
jgi:hypothetical protein